MPDYKDIVKHGWHPEKDGSSLKDSVKGLIGKGDKSKPSSTHVAPPISCLRDPSSFGPPPKRTSTASPASGRMAPYQTPLYHDDQPEETPAAPSPPKPYRVDTTGLSTTHLPPPPRRTPGPGTSSTPSPPPSYTHAKPPGPPPTLPPRLPPRNTPNCSTSPPPPTRQPQPSASSGYLNQSAISSLSSKGLSIPGFGIGSSPSTTSPPRTTAPSHAPQTTGTTWSQKQSALKTASNLHRDPSAVSASDAVSAASTLNNFRQRHGQQIAAGVRAGSGVAGRISAFTDHDGAQSGLGGVSVVGKKKPPPPPPPGKKPAVAARQGGGTGEADGGPEPPPVPLGTRPRF